MAEPHGRRADSYWVSTAPANGPFLTATTWIIQFIEFPVDGRIAGFRRYRQSSFTGQGFLLLVDNTLQIPLRAVHFPDDAGGSDAWQNAWIHPWFRVTPGDEYRLCEWRSTGAYMRTTNALSGGPVTHNQVTFNHGATQTGIDPIYTFPTPNNHANGIDVLFQPD